MTPINRKERALIAMLACAPDRRSTRRWLETKLWSESPPEKASASLRRALSNLRKGALGNISLFECNRHEVWLDASVTIDTRPGLAGQVDLLELVDVDDPEFDDWLRSLRAADAATPAEQPDHVSDGPAALSNGTLVVIRAQSQRPSDLDSFYTTIMVDTLSARLEAEGADEIYANIEPAAGWKERAATIVELELHTLVDDADWTVHLRALGGVDRRFLWSGRLRVPSASRSIATGIEAQAFASRALTQILHRFHAFRDARLSPMMLMQRAAVRLYDPNPDRVRLAEEDLTRLSSGEGMAQALAWRGFARMARAIEFGDKTDADEAAAMIMEAEALKPGNALISALVARVSLDSFGDVDKAAFHARNALLSDETNPYALQSASRIALMQDRADDAQELAHLARNTAEGLPHVFAWDFELGLAALARADLLGALGAMQSAHRSNPNHRATLRYLVATSWLVGEHSQARDAAKRLAQIEPGFRISDLRKPDYPVLTLRRLGLTDMLPEA